MKGTFNPDILRQLIEETGLSINELAAATGVSRAAIMHYLAGDVPGFGNMVALARYFVVSVEFLAGYYDEDIVKSVMLNYHDCYRQIRRDAYENYLISGRPDVCTRYIREGELPWPYNLLDAVFGKGNFADVVNAEHEANIVEVISSDFGILRSKAVILGYFRDGKTMAQIADSESVSHQRIQQIIKASLKRLRNPAIAYKLRYGKKAAALYDEAAKIEKELVLKRAELEALDKALEKKRAKLIPKKDHNIDLDKVLSLGIGDIHLSYRAHKALHRYGCRTVSDVVRVIKAGELLTVHNIGIKTAKGTVAIINSLTGLDLSLDE